MVEYPTDKIKIVWDISVYHLDKLGMSDGLLIMMNCYKLAEKYLWMFPMHLVTWIVWTTQWSLALSQIWNGKKPWATKCWPSETFISSQIEILEICIKGDNANQMDKKYDIPKPNVTMGTSLNNKNYKLTTTWGGMSMVSCVLWNQVFWRKTWLLCCQRF